MRVRASTHRPRSDGIEAAPIGKSIKTDVADHAI